MPLPKPSKMISKRFKKPKANNPYPFIEPPPPSSSSSSQQPLHRNHLWSDFPLRKWRVRVVCNDPDATDDSSADELDSSTSPSSARKRLIHEIFLPLPPWSPPQLSSPQATRTRRRRKSLNSNPIARSRKLCNDFHETEAILQDMDVILDGASEICIATAHPASPHNRAMMFPYTECGAAEEEFARFLSEFVPDNGEGDEGIDGLGMPQEDEITDLLNLELDAEALTWINSLQRLP